MPSFVPQSIFFLLCSSIFWRADPAPGSFAIAARFTEDMITLSWGEVQGARAFNVYADYGRGFVRANFTPVTARNRFVLMWIDFAGKKVRIVKGNSVTCRVTPLFAAVSAQGDTAWTEGRAGAQVSNDYFKGFSSILSDSACARILTARQTQARIFPAGKSTGKAEFCSRYIGPARDVYSIYKERIDPKDEGACVPFSTIVAKYFTKRGIKCYRAQGTFIGAFHSFNLVVIDDAEYVLDFTADQFVPGSSPVLLPRNCCFVDSCGRPTANPNGTFTALYNIDKVYDPAQIDFADTPAARLYSRLLDSLESR